MGAKQVAGHDVSCPYEPAMTVSLRRMVEWVPSIDAGRSGATPLQRPTDGAGSVGVWRHVEIHQGGAEAAGADSAVEDADGEPRAAGDFRWRAQMQPDEEADGEAGYRRGEVREALLFGAQEVAGEGGGVDAHEGDEGAEVEEFDAAFVAEEEGAGEGDGADEKDVVHGNAAARLDGAEEAARQRVAAAHAVEQAGGGELRTHAGADIGDQDREVEQME